MSNFIICALGVFVGSVLALYFSGAKTTCPIQTSAFQEDAIRTAYALGQEDLLVSVIEGDMK